MLIKIFSICFTWSIHRNLSFMWSWNFSWHTVHSPLALLLARIAPIRNGRMEHQIDQMYYASADAVNYIGDIHCVS